MAKRPGWRRAIRRIPVSFLASFGPVSLGRQEGTIVDLTLKGCRLQTQAPVPVNTYLELWLQTSPTAPKIFVDLAAVRWTLDGHLGIEFLSLQPKHHAKLKQVIEDRPLTTE